MGHLVNKYYDLSKLVIWGDDTGDEATRRSRLVFSFRDGNPRITVYSGIIGKDGVISFPSDHPTMVTAMSLLKDAAMGEPGTKFTIDSLTYVYENNKPTKEKRIVSTLHIGKSKDGLMYFSVIMDNKPKLVFTLKPAQFHVFRDKDKNVMSDSVISVKMALGLADMVLEVISKILVDYTNDEYDTGPRKPQLVKGNQTVSEPKTNIEELDDLAI